MYLNDSSESYKSLSNNDKQTLSRCCQRSDHDGRKTVIYHLSRYHFSSCRALSCYRGFRSDYKSEQLTGKTLKWCRPLVTGRQEAPFTDGCRISGLDSFSAWMGCIERVHPCFSQWLWTMHAMAIVGQRTGMEIQARHPAAWPVKVEGDTCR